MFIPIKRNVNCNANITNPYKAIILRDVSGNLTKNTAGILENKKRNAQSNIGDISSSPKETKRKLMPQIRTTKSANKRCEPGIIMLQQNSYSILKSVIMLCLK